MNRSLRRSATALLTAAVLLVPSLAAAQSGSNASGSNASDSNTTGTNTTGTNQPTLPNAASAASRTLAQLQRQALRLTLIARLPAADRQQAGQLLDRADALRQRAGDLRRQELQAYVDALQAGGTPADARALAQHEIAGDRASLTQEEATLRSDAKTFVQKVPQASAVLRHLTAGMGGRTQAYGRGPGSAPGWGPQLGAHRPGMRQGMRRPGMSPRDDGRGLGWGRSGPGASRDRRPYGWYGAPQNNTVPTMPPTTTPPAGGGDGGG